jgi:glycosyltransferase involved in cell wall biosynthesis
MPEHEVLRSEPSPNMRKVSVIQRELPHYRIRFFEELYAEGRLHDLDVHVYSAAPPTPTPSSITFPFQVRPARYFGKGRQCSYWLQGLEEVIAGSDVVVAPQELQCLTVPYLWARRRLICKTWIWWGHGYNFQAAVRPSLVTNVKEAVKEFMTRRADGLITYTERGSEYWRKRGIPDHRVIPYYNTIDVEELRQAAEKISQLQRVELRQKLMVEGKRVLLFSGRLYAAKNVEFLLRAFALLKTSRPEVALLVIGDGDERDRLQQMAKRLELQDVHFLGEIVTPKDTAAYFSLADLIVIPSLVGLVIVHGFAFGLPLLTTDSPGHGPELEYLNENNGVMTGHDPSRYAEAIRMLLSSPPRLEAMKRSALAQGDALKLEYSVRRFVNGITQLSKKSGSVLEME